jgi:hypothetical protein
VCVGVYPLPYRLPLPVLRHSYAHTAVGTDPGVAGRAAWPVRGTAKGKRRELARSLGIFSSQRQTNKQCCKRARRFRILETSHLRGNASRAREANGARVCRLRPSVHATRTDTPVGFTIYEVYRRLELQESTCIHHPSMFRGRSRIFLNSRAS